MIAVNGRTEIVQFITSSVVRELLAQRVKIQRSGTNVDQAKEWQCGLFSSFFEAFPTDSCTLSIHPTSAPRRSSEDAANSCTCLPIELHRIHVEHDGLLIDSTTHT